MEQRSEKIATWFNTPLGKRLLKAEMASLQTILNHLFGYYIVQIGGIGQGDLLTASRIKHRCLCYPHLTYSNYDVVHAHPDALPFAPDSIDVVLLPHVLEFDDHPHAVLREVERVLIPEGYVIIIGFNPISLWGLWHWFLKKRAIAPWCGKFLPVWRIRDWLALLGFEEVELHTRFFSPPFQNDYLMNKRYLLEHFGRRWVRNLGAVYILVAKKRVSTLTPLKPDWKLKATPSLISGKAINSNQHNKSN